MDAAALAGAWFDAMRRGDFEAAWRLNDRRLAEAPPDPRRFRQPRHLQTIWDGRPIDGRRVLVRCYHGLGDTLQFWRFLPALAARAASVVAWVQPALLPLLRGAATSSAGAPIELRPLHDGAPDADYDVDVELMELPWILRIRLDEVAAMGPYLAAEPWRPAGSDDDGRRRVGVVWRSGDWDPERSIPVERLAPLHRAPATRWIALQPARDDRDARLWPGEWAPAGDLVQFARLVAGLDLVIAVDTMCAHLAGALGRPVWTLLKHDADWRWLERRDDSPWYPTMRLFRQPRPGDWSSVAAAVAAAATPLPTSSRT